MSCEYPVLCPACGGSGAINPFSPQNEKLIVCPTCKGGGEVCPVKRDAYRAEHGPDC